MKCDELENKYYNNGMTAYELMEENGLVNTAKTVKAAIEELKAKLEDAGMRERRLQRALWLARGYIMALLQRDFQRLAYICNNDDYKRNLLRKRNRYYDLSEKCLKKAEEYK